MTYLLDTHYMLWVLSETNRLSAKIRNIVTDPDNRIIVSTVSFWEVALKSATGKLRIKGPEPQDLPDGCLQMGFQIKPLTAEDSSTFHHLKATHHRDPFDRMLIWQAIRNNYILISVDGDVKKYVSEGLKVLR